jgi:hypothetical protein
LIITQRKHSSFLLSSKLNPDSTDDGDAFSRRGRMEVRGIDGYEEEENEK